MEHHDQIWMWAGALRLPCGELAGAGGESWTVGSWGGNWGGHKRPKSEVLSKTGFCDQRVTPPSLLPGHLGREAGSSLGRCFSLGLPGQDSLPSSDCQRHQVMRTENIASEEWDTLRGP